MCYALKVLKDHGQDFLVGKQLSRADVQLLESILMVEELKADILSTFPLLKVNNFSLASNRNMQHNTESKSHQILDPSSPNGDDRCARQFAVPCIISGGHFSCHSKSINLPVIIISHS